MGKRNETDRLEKLAAEKQEKEARVKADNEKRLKERVDLALHLYDDIKIRAGMFDQKYNIFFKGMDDGHVFDKYKNVESINTEFSGILDKITNLMEKTPADYHAKAKTLSKAYKIRDELIDTKVIYLKNLEEEITQRDLSAEKLQTAAILKIELPKFKGYNSSMDIYSFQTEFEKLISPRIQKNLLPEYLKLNYLEGPALLLVKEIVDIESIWGKESFGCANLLLQNKLCDVEKLGPIWKIRDNEKLIPPLSNLVNVMSDLKVLAHKHKIENALHHSSNLGIIYNQIGNQRESKFISKNIDIRMDERGKWNKIIEFLRREVRIKEEQVLSEKARTHISEPTHKY